MKNITRDHRDSAESTASLSERKSENVLVSDVKNARKPVQHGNVGDEPKKDVFLTGRQTRQEKKYVNIYPITLPATVLRNRVSNVSDLIKITESETGGIVPAVFVVEKTHEGETSSVFSLDFLKRCRLEGREPLESLAKNSVLAFLCPNGACKEISVDTLGIKENSGYVLSVLLHINLPLYTRQEFYEHKILLSACLTLGWFQAPDVALAKDLLVGLNEEHASQAVQKIFHSAIDAKNKALVDLMIEWGADVNAVNRDDNMSPLHAAQILQLEEIEESLLNAGATMPPEEAGWAPGSPEHHDEG